MPQEIRRGALIGSTLGGYRLTELLGYGGMAEVYRARESPGGRGLAIKVLPAQLAQDPEYVTRFRNEARRVAALSHPHIVPLYHFGEERGLLYLVMPQLVESLRDRLDRERPLDPPVAVRVATQIAAALDAAHHQGLVHRDVKPENILLDGKGQALLTDFGIARELAARLDEHIAPTLASTGLPIGTPEYMAPEQLRGDPADQRADVYALGAVLYEMLTGRVPHDADTPYQVAARVLVEPTKPPSVYNPDVWPALESVVLGALAKDPVDRYQDMPSFSAALEGAATPGQVSSPSPADAPRTAAPAQAEANGSSADRDPAPLIDDDRTLADVPTLNLPLQGAWSADGGWRGWRR